MVNGLGFNGKRKNGDFLVHDLSSGALACSLTFQPAEKLASQVPQFTRPREAMAWDIYPLVEGRLRKAQKICRLRQGHDFALNERITTRHLQPD